MTFHAAAVDISPTQSLALFGRQGPIRGFKSIASGLEANIILDKTGDQTLALICIDSLYPSAALLEAVHTNVQSHGIAISKDDMLMVASHTHNAPALDPTKPLLGPVSEAYLKMVGEKIAVAIVALVRTNGCVPVLKAGEARCAGSVFRRKSALGLSLRPFGVSRNLVMAPVISKKIDQRLRLFIWRDSDNTPVAALWHWACHAVSEAGKFTLSADFPGLVRARLRHMLGNDKLPVMYFPGFSADIRPASIACLPLLRTPKGIGVGYRFARNTTKRQDILVANVFKALQIAYLSQAPLRIDRASTTARRLIAVADLRDQVANSHPITVDHWQFHGLKITAVSSEVSSEYGMVDEITALETGCAQQVFGYLPTDAQIREGGYEVDGFASAFSIPGRFHAKIETSIREAIRWPQSSTHDPESKR